MLLDMRERLSNQIAALKGDSLKREDSVNSMEDGTDAFERQFALTIASSEQQSLSAIDEALRRIDEGTYGVCEACGGLVERPRLKALPFVRLCIGCQSASEKGKARFRVGLGAERMDVPSDAVAEAVATASEEAGGTSNGD
jgi:RNA polymerase-binding transcription factor DksA